MKFGIFGNLDKPQVPPAVRKLAEWFERAGVSYVIEEDLVNLLDDSRWSDKAVPAAEIAQKCEMLITFGGDGTILSAAHLVGSARVPILGVNTGRLGFLTETDTENLFTILERLVNGEYVVEERMTLAAEISYDGSPQKRMNALNDVILDKGSFSRTITFDVHIGKEHFHTYVADGVIISTPTGSTAYSLSAGGPILVPTIDGIIISPICPHSLAARPVVIPADSEIFIELKVDQKGTCFFADGQFGAPFPAGSKARIAKGNYTVQLVHCSQRSFYELLRTKFKWGFRSNME